MAKTAHSTGAKARPHESPSPALRRKLEAEIDRLIDLLDTFDGDPDLEPTLGAPESTMHFVGYLRHFSCEPLVRHVEPVDSQTSWARGQSDDDEQVNEDGGNITDEGHDDIAADMEPFEPTDFYPNGAHLSGGGSGI